jgi:hypothetical protein
MHRRFELYHLVLHAYATQSQELVGPGLRRMPGIYIIIAEEALCVNAYVVLLAAAKEHLEMSFLPPADFNEYYLLSSTFCVSSCLSNSPRLLICPAVGVSCLPDLASAARYAVCSAATRTACASSVSVIATREAANGLRHLSTDTPLSCDASTHSNPPTLARISTSRCRLRMWC